MHGNTLQRVTQNPSYTNGSIQADDSVRDVAKEGRLKDSQQEKTDGDLGEGDLNLVAEDEDVEELL